MESRNDAPPPFGGFWERALCYCVDGWVLKPPLSIVIIGLYLCFAIGLAGGILAAHGINKAGIGLLILYAAVFIVCLIAAIVFLNGLYAGYFLSRFGTTPGKLLMDLKVVRASSGERLSFSHGFMRELAKLLSLIPLGFGFFMAGWDPEKRALHDRICGTRVVRGQTPARDAKIACDASLS